MPKYFKLLETHQSPVETKPVDIPASVERAIKINFGVPITGYLCCALFDHGINCLVGIVFRESRGRFEDGATIRTSTLIRKAEHGDYMLFETIGGSRYVICDWAQEGGSPRFAGVLH